MLLRRCPHVSGYFWKLKKIHIHTKCIQIIFAYPHENAIKNDGNVIDDVFMVYDIIVFENLCFHLSTCKQKAGVFKDFNLGERFWKDVFLVIMYDWTVDQTGEKVMSFFKQNRCVWTGPIIISTRCYKIMSSNQTLCPALASSQKWNPCYSRLAYCTDLHSRLSYII